MAGHIAEFAHIGGGHGAFHNADEAVGIFHGLVQGIFGSFAGGGHDGFMVVQRNGVEDQGIKEGFVGAQQGFGAARAFGKVQIDHRGALARKGGGHFRRKGRPHAHGHGHRRTEFHEVAAADASAFQALVRIVFAQSHGNTHKSLLANGENLQAESGAQLGQTACTHPAAPAGAHMRTAMAASLDYLTLPLWKR